jgi:CDP-glucose 4,6-dehydratase
MVKAFDQGKELVLRFPNAIRPWQHVLDPLYGYLQLVELLYGAGREYSRAWNFGPLNGDAWRVADIARYAAKSWGGRAKWSIASEKQPHEDCCLRIDSSMANEKIGWKPRLDMEAALSWTFEWYHLFSHQPSRMRDYSLKQIEQFESLCRRGQL